MSRRAATVLASAVAAMLLASGTGRAIVRVSAPNYAPTLVGLTVSFRWTAVPGLAETPCGMVGRAVISDPNTPNGRGPITAFTTRSAHGWQVASGKGMEMSLNWRGRSPGSPATVRLLTGSFEIKNTNRPLVSAGFASGINVACPVQAPRPVAGEPSATFGIRVPLDLPNYQYAGTVCAYIHIAGGPSKFNETIRFAKALPLYGSGPRTKPCS